MRFASFAARVAVVALAVLAGAGPAVAFNIIGSSANPAAGPLLRPTTLPANGIFRHWDLREFDNCTIPISANQAGTGDIVGIGEFTAIDNAAASWTNVAPALPVITRVGNVALAAQAMDNTNLIWWDNTNASGLIGAAGSGILGVTSIYTQVATGRIQESDIVFNDRDFQWNTNADDFTSVRTAAAAPWNVNNGQTIVISVDGGANQTITLAGVTNGAATPAQIAATINAQIAGAVAFTVGNPVDRVQVVSSTENGTGTINVVGGTANGALGFPGGATLTDAADVETICLHEMGHLLGIHHSSQASPEPNLTYFNAVMYWAAPDNGTKRVLTQDDTNALNFLYTPDLGDAPDPGTQTYQTLVHTATNSRTLNGVQLHTPGTGPEHLFGYFGEDSLKLEWLGTSEDGSAAECEALLTDVDASDNGVSFPFPMYRAIPNVVTVTISYKNAARYNSAVPGQRLMFNGYFDWNNDQVFDNSDLEIWWTGDPTNGTFSSSPNWTGATYNPGTITLTFNETPPANAPSTYARFRLDLGEDEGRVANINGDNAPATGGAQFGEVEDYRVATTNAPPTAVQVARFDAVPADGGIDVSWSTPQGGLSGKVNLYRSDAPGIERFLGTVDPGPDGGRYHDAEVVAGSRYVYRLGLFDQDGEVRGPSVEVTLPGAALALAGMAPNPVDRSGVVTFSLPRAGHAELALFGVDGRRMRKIADGEFGAGEHHLDWDGTDASGNRMAPGVYFLELRFGAETRVSRMLILR